VCSNRLSDIIIKDVAMFRHAHCFPSLTRLPWESFIVPGVGSPLRFPRGGVNICPDFYCPVCLDVYWPDPPSRVLHVVLKVFRTLLEWMRRELEWSCIPKFCIYSCNQQSNSTMCVKAQEFKSALRASNCKSLLQLRTCTSCGNGFRIYKVVQIWPGLICV